MSLKTIFNPLLPNRLQKVAVLPTISETLVQEGQTINATQTTLANSKVIADDSVISFVSRITAIEPATGDSWVHEIRGAIKKLGIANAVIVDTITDEYFAEDIGAVLWSATIEAGTNTIDIKVIGEALHTIEWKAETIFNVVTY